MKKFLLAFIVLVILLTGAFAFIYKKNQAPKVHYHAGFVIFKDNKQVDFSDFKYMVVKPCTTSKTEEKETPEDNQIEKAHLHDLVGDVVHVERENSKWSDLFTNLKYNMDYSKTTAYINGKKVDNFQDLVIQPYDSLVILIGSSDAKTALSKAVKVTHIKDAEKRSENCSS